MIFMDDYILQHNWWSLLTELTANHWLPTAGKTDTIGSRETKLPKVFVAII